jgi:cytidine deaminase
MDQPDYLPKMLEAARQAALQAYAPYSQFTVGAAIWTRSDRIITGCNVENSSFGLTICAERTAATRAIVEGDLDWLAIAVVSPSSVTPCGACRQFLAEFAPRLEVWYAYLDPSQPVSGPVSLEDLLPGAMTFSHSRGQRKPG